MPSVVPPGKTSCPPSKPPDPKPVVACVKAKTPAVVGTTSASAKSTPIKSPELKRLRKVHVDFDENTGTIKNLEADFDQVMVDAQENTVSSESLVAARQNLIYYILL